MSRYTKTDVTIGDTVKSDVNVQLGLIETAIADTLSRVGDLPNTMSADLDMNSNQILNLPDAVTSQEPMTLSQGLATIAWTSALSDAKYYDTVANATADTTLVAGDIVILKDRANGVFDVVLTSSVTPNTFNIIIGVADPLISFVLRSGRNAKVSQWTPDLTNAAAAIQAANDLSTTVGLIFDQVYTIATATTLTLTKTLYAPDSQIFNAVGTLNFEGLSSHRVSSLWFAVDAWDSLKVASETLASYRGGTIDIAPAIYNADVEISISSEYPVNLKSRMQSAQQLNDSVIIPENYITPMTGIGATDALIEYTGDGGGRVEGLFFIDANDLSNATQASRRTVVFGAAIRFTEWNLSRMTDCYFAYLDAVAIEAILCTMSTVDNVWVRRCGGTSKPAIHLNPGVSNGVQSFEISSSRVEVNYSASYIKLESDCTACKLTNIGLEADTAEAATAQTLIDDAGTRTQGDTIHLNRTSTTKLTSTGSEGTYTNIAANSGDGTNVVNSTGAGFTLTGYKGLNHVSAVDEITSSALDFTFQGSINNGGGIRCTADFAIVDAIQRACDNGTNGVIEVASKSTVKARIHDSTITSKDLIYLAGATNIIQGCHIEDVPSGQSAIYAAAASSQNVINGNQIIAGTGTTGVHTIDGAGSNNVSGNNIQGAGTATNLDGTDTADGTNT